MTATRIVVWGAAGRMGRAIDAVSAERDDVEVVARVGRGGAPEAGLNDVVVIDVSAPEGALASLAWAAEHGAAWVSGTTGTGPALDRAMNDASRTIAVLHATNMSLGVAVLRHLVAVAAAALPAEFEAELVELHHRHKKDAPSGTALTLARTLAAARGVGDDAIDTERSGLVGARDPERIGVFGVRGGDVVGEHTVYFLGDGERVELTHRATDRAIFARGAVTAARWVDGRPPGRYTIDDVLGLG